MLSNSERLPSLPTITLEIRKAICDPDISAQSLARLVAKDPALTALLIKAASGPHYRRVGAPKTLADVIAVLGYANVGSLVMVHSVRSLFVLRSAMMKQLFSRSWNRLVLKTSLASFFAQRLDYRPLDQAQVAALLSEVGALAVLSAMSDSEQTPSPEAYFMLCRQYARSVGSVLLQKWGVDADFITVQKQSGLWEQTVGDKIGLLDIANLATYYTALFTKEGDALPPLQSLAAYQKLPQEHQRCVNDGWLALVVENKNEILETLQAFK